MSADEAVVEVSGLGTRYGERVVHEDVSVTVRRGEILAIVGGSGSGKSTLMRHMALLESPRQGRVQVFGKDVAGLRPAAADALRRRIGVLFQGGALFSGLSVLENVGLPLRERSHLRPGFIEELAALKLALVGLTPEDGLLAPAQLSGGMRKRAALARALVLDPELLFLDEPTAGLDPVAADAFDELICDLCRSLGPTVVIVTHDMDSLWRITDRVVLLGEARVLAEGSVRELAHSRVPAVQAFFQSRRGRAAQASA